MFSRLLVGCSSRNVSQAFVDHGWSFSLRINEMPPVLPANLSTLSSDLLSIFSENTQAILSCQKYSFEYVV